MRKWILMFSILFLSATILKAQTDVPQEPPAKNWQTSRNKQNGDH